MLDAWPRQPFPGAAPPTAVGPPAPPARRGARALPPTGLPDAGAPSGGWGHQRHVAPPGPSLALRGLRAGRAGPAFGGPRPRCEDSPLYALFLVSHSGRCKPRPFRFAPDREQLGRAGVVVARNHGWAFPPEDFLKARHRGVGGYPAGCFVA